MISVFYDENNKVNLIYYQEVPHELEGFPKMQVNALPEAEVRDGYETVLKCDGSNLWYEYVEVEPGIEEEIKQLKAELELANATITELVLNGYAE